MIIKNISKEFFTKTEKVVALNNVSCSFEKGKFYAITGHSGSGKSTLLKILGLIENHDSGEYFFQNKNIKDLSDDEKSDIRMKFIGFVFQDYFLDVNLKSYENVILPMYANKNISKKERKNKAIQLLNKVGMNNRIYHFPNQLSGGEQQRVAIARALANNPNYILADEPTGNLDEENEKIVFELLKKLTLEGKCVIVVSHSKEVLKYSDYIINLKNGRIE